jgi:hypothetical protein
MNTRLIEATSDGGNWGKFMVARFDREWARQSEVSMVLRGKARPESEPASPTPLLHRCGWAVDHLLVVDLQTGEGAIFKPGGLAGADLLKHRIWVCPLFEPFLGWLYRQDLDDLARLPEVVELEAPLEMQGYRREGA